MSWTTIAVITVGLLVAVLRVVGAEDADAPTSRCDGGRPECATVAPRVGAPPPLAGIGGGNTGNLPTAGSGTNASSKGSDRHDIGNVSSSSVIRPEASGSAIQGTSVSENSNRTQIEDKYDPKESVASEEVKKQEIVQESLKDKEKINWKSEDKVLRNEDLGKHEAIPTLQTPEGKMVTMDVNIPSENGKHLSVSRHLDLSYKKINIPDAVRVSDLGSPSADIPSSDLNGAILPTETAYITTVPQSKDSVNLDLKVESKDLHPTEVEKETPMKVIHSPAQNTSTQEDMYHHANHAKEDSFKQLESLEHQKEGDPIDEATDNVASVKTESPGMKAIAEDTTKHSTSPVSQIVPLPNGLIRSQVAEPVHPEFKDTILSQRAESKQNAQAPLTNEKSASNDSSMDTNISHSLHSGNVTHKESVETAQDFIPAANELKATSVGHSRNSAVTTNAAFSSTAVAGGVASDSKVGHVVDQVHQELEDATTGTAHVTSQLNVPVNNQNSAIAAPGVEPAPRTLLPSQVVDPVHQELEETTPATLVKTATSNPASTGTPAAIGSSKVAFEFTNHVSVIYNETGGGPPADNIHKDLLVENGSRMSYATAFVHSVELGDDDDDHDDDDEKPLSTTAAGSPTGVRKAVLQNAVTRLEGHGPADSAHDGRHGLLHGRVNNNDSSDIKLKELQQQLHALKSDGVSTQPPINTLKPTLEKDFAALKDLRIGIIQLQTTEEPLLPNKYTDMPSIESRHNKIQEQQNAKITTSDVPQWMLNDTTVEPRLSEESAVTGELIANSEIKQIQVPTSAVPTTTSKDKTQAKDEDIKLKTKTAADFATRNKKLTTGATSNQSDLWTRILPVSSPKPQLLNKTDEISNLRNSEERENVTTATEKLSDFSDGSHVLPMNMQSHSNSSEKEIFEEKEMVPVPISTVVPSTVISHRHERVDNTKAETIVLSDAVQEEVNIINSTTSRTLPIIAHFQVNDRKCKTDENCNGNQGIHDELDVLSAVTTTAEPFTATGTYYNAITEVATEEGPTTENIEIKFTTLSSLVEKSIGTETSMLISTDAVPTTITYPTVPFTSDQFVSVPAVDNSSDSANVYSSTEEPQDVHIGTEFYGTTVIPLGNVKGEGNVFSTVIPEVEQATQAAQTLPPPEVGSTTRQEGNQWFYGDQPQEGSNYNGWQEQATTISSNKMPLTTTVNVPEPTTEQVPDKELSEWDIPDKSETVAAFCRLKLLASGEQVCLYLGGLPSNIAELLQEYTGRVIMYQQVVIHMPGSEVRCDDITRERILDVYIQDENGSFDYNLSVLLKKIWDENHPKLPLQIVNMELVKEDVNETTSAPPDPGFEPDPNGEITPGLLAAIIVACIGTVSLLLLFGLMVYVRRRQKRFNYGQRCTPVSLDAYSVDSISVYDSVRSRSKRIFRTSKRSYGNLAFDDPNSPSHPMNFAGLANFSSDMDALQEEFEAVPQITVTTDDLPTGADVKNRYSNVIPLPETRVPLTPKEGEPLSDYINANYVRGPNNEEKFYIACQAPLQSTITDFWRMVWEQQTKVILMVCNLVEDGSEKCADYLPPSEVLDCHRLFGDFQITLKKREEKERYVISTLQIKNLESNLWREVIHIWFASWPDKGVPDDPSPLIAFLIESRSHMRSAPGPHVVHCSPGTGRTGTVIACDILIREFERTRAVDVPRCVYRLRRDRAGAVKTKEQYIFIYKVLNHYAAMLTGGALDSI